MDRDILKCPECGKIAALARWGETTVWCDICSDRHEVLECPSCGEVCEEDELRSYTVAMVQSVINTAVSNG